MKKRIMIIPVVLVSAFILIQAILFLNGEMVSIDKLSATNVQIIDHEVSFDIHKIKKSSKFLQRYEYTYEDKILKVTFYDSYLIAQEYPFHVTFIEAFKDVEEIYIIDKDSEALIYKATSE